MWSIIFEYCDWNGWVINLMHECLIFFRVVDHSGLNFHEPVDLYLLVTLQGCGRMESKKLKIGSGKVSRFFFFHECNYDRHLAMICVKFHRSYRLVFFVCFTWLLNWSKVLHWWTHRNVLFLYCPFERWNFITTNSSKNNFFFSSETMHSLWSNFFFYNLCNRNICGYVNSSCNI